MLKIAKTAIAVLTISAPCLAAEGGVTNLNPEQLAWQKTPEGVAFAPLIGDRFAEPYMAMVRLPAGLVSPAHTKSADMFGVVVSGAMVHTALGSDATETILREGSFYRIPKDFPHISKCVSATDCVTFLYQDGKFDFRPVAQ